MDLSPDSSLLAVAQLRAVLAEGNESDAGLRGAHSSSKQQTSFPRPSERGRGQLCPASLGGALYSSTPDAEGSVNFVRVEGPRATQGVVKEWGGGVACAPDAAVFPPRVEGFADGRHVTQAAPSRNGVAVAADCVAPVARSEAHKARKSDLAWTPPTSLGAADAASSGGRSPGSATSAQARTRAKRSVWRVEGETAILSVAEGLKVVKTLAVADAAAFTSVEFSRNGKHLLMSGGATDSSFCVDCRACSCCCLCYFALRDTPAVERLKREQGVSRRATAPSARDEAGASDSSSESDGCCESACTDREREAEGASEAWKQKRADTPNIRSKVKYGLKCGVQGPDPENRPAHRAQVVNLLQSNRLSVLKSPADGALAFADAALLQHSLHSKEGNQQEPCPPSESAFHSPLSWPAADFDRVQALQFLPPFLESRLSSDSLRLRLFSPHSRLLDCRRRAFWKDPASAFPQPSRDDRQRPSAPPPARSVDTAFAMAEAAGCPAAAVSPPQGLPRENKSEPCRDSGASREGQPGASSGRPAITPFPKCHPQVSQFLSACGPLHPHWGRPSCMQERFVASLWGGLVAGVGGSRHYPGLKLWQATTGVVLSWTEGELASAEAVRCIRGHPDLSTGLLATGGALPAHTRGSISRGNGRRPNLSASVEGGLRRTRRRETEPGVTLWSLVHRDVLLEAALNRDEDSNFLLVDPTDDESDC
ncbi:hypothetical protein BESB_040720 [Besnoitia besnoiti]|uniref:Uncharacterized protein n=1 Tax=Besnoitia besnoiti TaxID=94643 RepID=A0A2A9MK84_BESBE|nr:hypothetical protein BESB_040720 [Besnoitia besnoiti]PFH37614.1 hypothetical protein BESB_040720 [Besnoitia besnoiti]